MSTAVSFGFGDAKVEPMNLHPEKQIDLMATWKLIAFVVALFALTLQADSRLLLKPESAEMNQRAPDVCHVRLQTTKGDIRMEMRREWAPNGVDRFYNLVRHGYYDQ